MGEKSPGLNYAQEKRSNVNDTSKFKLGQNLQLKDFTNWTILQLNSEKKSTVKLGQNLQ